MSKQPLNNFVLRWALTFISLVLLIYFAFFHHGHIQSGKEHGCCSAAHDPVSSSLSSRVPYNETSCSSRAFQVGDNQKVIAYVYYDDPENTMTESRKYFYGIEVNAEVNQRLYPGWRMWVYHDVNEGSDKFRYEVSSTNLIVLGRGGVHVITVLAVYSTNPSSVPAKAYSFFCKFYV